MTAHPSADQLFTWIEGSHSTMFVMDLDARECGPDDGRTGMAIVAGFSVDSDPRHDPPHVSQTWEYSEQATPARYVMRTTKMAVRKAIAKEHRTRTAYAKANGYKTDTRALSKAYRLITADLKG